MLNGQHNAIPPELGGHYTLIGWCHTSFELIPPGQYFAQHPEWFAQVKGRRQTESQLCLSNAAMRKELIGHALRKVRKNPEAGMISISQNDTHGACECDACARMVAEEGSQAGPWVRLCNEAADAIKVGPGTSRRSHTPDESVDLVEVTEARSFYRTLAAEYLQ
jgi:hypothetical protein